MLECSRLFGFISQLKKVAESLPPYICILVNIESRLKNWIHNQIENIQSNHPVARS